MEIVTLRITHTAFVAEQADNKGIRARFSKTVKHRNVTRTRVKKKNTASPRRRTVGSLTGFPVVERRMNGICLRSKWGHTGFNFSRRSHFVGNAGKKKQPKRRTGFAPVSEQRTSYGEQETVRVVYFPPLRGPSETNVTPLCPPLKTRQGARCKVPKIGGTVRLRPPPFLDCPKTYGCHCRSFHDIEQTFKAPAAGHLHKEQRGTHLRQRLSAPRSARSQPHRPNRYLWRHYEDP